MKDSRIFENFKEVMCDKIYFYDSSIKEDVIKQAHEDFIDSINQAFKLSKVVVPEFEEIILEEQIIQIIEEKKDDFFNYQFKDKTIKNDGYCLAENIIGKATYFLHDKDMLGVITDFDRNNNRCIIVDFGDSEPVKVYVDEIKI